MDYFCQVPEEHHIEKLVEKANIVLNDPQKPTEEEEKNTSSADIKLALDKEMEKIKNQRIHSASDELLDELLKPDALLSDLGFGKYIIP